MSIDVPTAADSLPENRTVTRRAAGAAADRGFISERGLGTASASGITCSGIRSAAAGAK